MKKTVLKKYAELIVRCGANVQKGQEVIVVAGLDQPEFVQMVVEEAYKAKAKKVTVDWRYQPLSKVHVRYQSQKTLGTVEEWEKARLEHYCEANPARIMLISDDPDGLKGMNITKLNKARQMSFPIMRPYLDQMEGNHQWTIAAVPGAAWAKKIFPGVRTSVAMEKLWEAILYTSRVNEDPIAAWNEHNHNMESRCEYLNNLGLRKVRMYADNGTDITIGLISEGVFCGGGETTRQGVFFNPNIPTEECFTSPMKGQADGIVYSTKPLSYQGQIIDNFSIRFENGKAVEWHAEQGVESLTQMLTMDETAGYLGEVALVPQESPICQSGLLFYNTLFDENAACHLAVGRGFPDCIRDHHNKTLEECRELGINDSMIHVDFMIGCDTMSIDGECENGEIVPIFRNGNWAF